MPPPRACWLALRCDRKHAAPQLRHPSDGSRSRSCDHRLAHGTSQSPGDRRLPARSAPAPRGGRAYAADRRATHEVVLLDLRCTFARTAWPAVCVRSTLAAYEAALQQFRDWIRVCTRATTSRCRHRSRCPGVPAASARGTWQRRLGGQPQLSILRSFYRAIVAMGHLEPAANPMAGFPSIKAVPRKLPIALEPEQVSRLLVQT